MMTATNDIRERQLRQLKEAAKIFLAPLERLPFPVVVEAMTGYELLPITNSKSDAALLARLSAACIAVVAESTSRPVTANRPNDVSTQIEERLEASLCSKGIRVDFPSATRGKRSSGYPDRLIWYEDNPTYLEVKVSRESNMAQGSARNFYYQPSRASKICYSARHLLVGFAIREVSEKRWVLLQWKVVDLWFLRVKLKPEYNADNIEIYKKEAVLMEGNGARIVRQKALW